MFRKSKRPPNRAGIRRKADEDDENGSAVRDFNGGSEHQVGDGDGNDETTLELREASKRAKLVGNKRARDETSSRDASKSLDASSTEIMHRFETPAGSSSSSRGGPQSHKDLATSTNEYLPTKSTVNPTRNKFLAGPIRAPTNIRTTARFDYQPDICKDYKDTGFCGFGDTCIYLHDRGDTMSGWQLEQAWQKEQQSKKQQQERQMEAFMNGSSAAAAAAANGGLDDADAAVAPDDGLPFACYLCRKAFDEPIVTPCGHYFCQSCLQKQLQDANDNSKCPICQKETHGVMNQPTKLIAKKRKLLSRTATWQDFMDARANKTNTSNDESNE